MEIRSQNTLAGKESRAVKPGPKPGNRTAWGGTLRRADLEKMMHLFGFFDVDEFAKFIEQQANKS